MTHTIRNPVEWSAEQLASASRHVSEMGAALNAGVSGAELPQIRNLTYDDLRAALRAGVKDFMRSRSDVLFLCLLYPVVGALLVYAAFDGDLMAMIFPTLSGFALVGPLAGVGLCEMSRRLERGEEVNWAAAFGVIGAPSFAGIVVLGIVLVSIFVIWMVASMGINTLAMGTETPPSLSAFVASVLTTQQGWLMILLGFSVGFVLAAIVLVISVVSFPLMLDRKIGVPLAVVTSVRVSAQNPKVIAAWGAIVAGLLALGSLPALLGLMIVLPILGHATWHLYRRAVVPEGESA